MNVFNLGGHSGCKILLYDDGIKSFIRKISKSKDYNDRLLKQCSKQANFVNPFIKAPKIIKSGIDEDGLFYFDMEYIQGVTLSEYIKGIEISKIKL